MSEHQDRMTCEEAFRRLDDFIDRQLNPEEMRLVQGHLAVCAKCSREFTFETSVIKGVRDRLSRIDVPPNLLARIASSLTGESPTPPDDAG